MDRTQAKAAIAKATRILSEAFPELAISIKRATFDGSSIELKIAGVDRAASGAGNLDELNWNRHHAAFGLRPEWLGKTFICSGKLVKITGLSPNRRKYPVIGKFAGSTRGHLYSADLVRRQLDTGRPSLEPVAIPVAGLFTPRNGQQPSAPVLDETAVDNLA